MIHRYSCLWIRGISGVDGASDPLFWGEGGGGKIPYRKGTRQDIGGADYKCHRKGRDRVFSLSR